MAGDSIVGRAGELAELDRLVEGTLRGRGAVAAVIGEAGIGKSRLLAEVSARAAEAGLVVLAGRAVSGGGTYRELASALVGRLREVDLSGDVGLRPYRAALGRVLPDFGPLARVEAAVDSGTAARGIVAIQHDADLIGGAAVDAATTVSVTLPMPAGTYHFLDLNDFFDSGGPAPFAETKPARASLDFPRQNRIPRLPTLKVVFASREGQRPPSAFC